MQLINSINNNISYPSSFHLDCAKYLKSMDIEFKNEIEINGLIVDICFSKTNIIIELNGPLHYAHQSRKPLGPTEFKIRLLIAMGWQVISIPWWDWSYLNNDDKYNYLKNKIKCYSREV